VSASVDRRLIAQQTTAQPITTKVIKPEDFVELVARGVDASECVGARTAPGSGGSAAFSTDTEISGKASSGAGRTLVAWQPDGDSDASGALALDEHAGDEWDQFAVNEAKFGVTSTWNEEKYTTTIDRSASDYKRKLRDASRVAAEIEAEGRTAITTNVHMLEERGEDVR
jgi:PAB1-binding protein PBP1